MNETDQRLLSAVKTGNVTEINRAILDGADADCYNEDLQSPLHLAVIHDWDQLAQLLCANGADVSHYNGLGFSPLHQAAYCNAVNCVELLLSLGAKIDLPTGAPLPDMHKRVMGKWERSSTPLHLAIHKSSITAARCLIRNGANIDAQDASGSTPLHYAAGMENENAFILLVSSGAAISIVDKDGNSPLHKTVQFESKEDTSSGSENKNSSQIPHIPDAVLTEVTHLIRVKTLCRRGADICQRNNEGKTALDVAREHGHGMITKYLDTMS